MNQSERRVPQPYPITPPIPGPQPGPKPDPEPQPGTGPDVNPPFDPDPQPDVVSVTFHEPDPMPVEPTRGMLRPCMKTLSIDEQTARLPGVPGNQGTGQVGPCPIFGY